MLLVPMTYWCDKCDSVEQGHASLGRAMRMRTEAGSVIESYVDVFRHLDMSLPKDWTSPTFGVHLCPGCSAS